jgi:hypothetical protein
MQPPHRRPRDFYGTPDTLRLPPQVGRGELSAVIVSAWRKAAPSM